MNELIDLKRIWDWILEKWSTAFGCVLFLLLSFWFGMEVQERAITSDCKFMGSFREGHETYNCSMRVR
jgi:hypothetical protein